MLFCIKEECTAPANFVYLGKSLCRPHFHAERRYMEKKVKELEEDNG